MTIRTRTVGGLLAGLAIAAAVALLFLSYANLRGRRGAAAGAGQGSVAAAGIAPASAATADSGYPEEGVDLNNRLTPAEIAENDREIALMRNALPGNLFIPGEPTGAERRVLEEHLRRGTELGNRVRGGTATPAEKREYLGMMRKRLQDRIDVVEYCKRRTVELGGNSGREYYSAGDLEQIDRALEEFRRERDNLERELNAQ